MGDLISGELTYKAEGAVTRSGKAGGSSAFRVPASPRWAKLWSFLAAARFVSRSKSTTRPGTNYSPYSFNNPSLLPLTIQEPLNRPSLRRVDFIKGNVTGVIPTNSANYTNATNPSASMLATFNPNTWTVSGTKRTMIVNIANVQNKHVHPRSWQQSADQHAG